MTTHIEQERADAVREARRYIDSIRKNGLVPLGTVLADLEAAAYRMEQGMTARGNMRQSTRPEPPVTEAEVERAAYRYWLESARDAEGDYPNREWEPDEREQFMWAARIVLEAVREGASRG